MKFEWIGMGTGQKKLANGSFSNGGDWKLMKCFYKDEGRYGEFFININASTGEGEIVYKDKISYGEALVAGFSKEMLDL